MNDHLPNSPFSTRLSGSAKETELRIRSLFQWKKQRPPVWLMAAMAALILSCGGLVSCRVQHGDDGSTPPGEEPGDTSYAQAFYQILTQDAPFLDSASGMTWRLSQLEEMIWSDPEVDVRVERFAVADRDADGTPEVVILTNQHTLCEPFLILRWQDGQVYSYRGVGRTFLDLKADGTSEWSDGPYSNGFSRDRYQPSEDGGADVCMADMLGEYGALDEEPWYTLNGREVSREEYEAALDAQRAKPSAVWYELTAENAAVALGVSPSLVNQIRPEWIADTYSEYLTQEQLELLADLPAAELPREAVDIFTMTTRDLWRDTLVPLLYDQEADVTVYQVAAFPDGSPQDLGPYPGQSFSGAGIVLRVGDRAAYYPLYLDTWYDSGCWMEVGDFNGDRKDELALCLFSGRGVGVHTENLYLFDLETMEYTVPNYAGFYDISVTYDQSAHTAALSLPYGDTKLLVDVSAYEPFNGVHIGEQVEFSCADNTLYCTVMLAFSGRTLGYELAASAPIIWEDGHWALGRVTLGTP